MIFEAIYFADLFDVLDSSKPCDEKEHFQQAAYSIYKNIMTIICFDCKTIRTNDK